jgi:hypothetical protein
MIDIKEKIKQEGGYKAFIYKGFQCRILRHNVHLCGYIGIPKGHKLYGKSCDDIEIDVHGGLTYARDSLRFQPEKDLWWIGFDCAHAGDFSDFYEDMTLDNEDIYRDMEYVENEIKSMVDQIINY